MKLPFSMSMVRRFEFMGQKVKCSKCGEATVEPREAHEADKNNHPILCRKCLNQKE